MEGALCLAWLDEIAASIEVVDDTNYIGKGYND
jgi:hypothetical protein